MRRHYRGWVACLQSAGNEIRRLQSVQIFPKFQRGQESDKHFSPNVIHRSTFLMLEVDGTHVVLIKRDQPATAKP